MKRALLIFLFAVPLSGTGERYENRFARAYNEWVCLRNVNRTEVLNAPEVLKWREVKSAWRALEKNVDKEYRGY